MNITIDHILAGVSAGGQYALIAIGYTMVYGILRLINFAHGDVFMVAGLIMVYASASLPLYVSIPIVLVGTVLLGVLIESAAYRPLRSAPRMSRQSAYLTCLKTLPCTSRAVCRRSIRIFRGSRTRSPSSARPPSASR